MLKVGAVRWGRVAVAVAVACACGALAPAANATLGVPTGGPPVPFTAPSASYPSVSSAMAAFEAAAGGGNNLTTLGEQGTGYRHATWDQIVLNGSDPGSTTIEAGHVTVPARSRLQPWGLDLGPEIAVSGDGFQSVNSSTFTPFSPANVWGAFNSNMAELDVVAPAGQGSTPTPAQTRGLGIVFLNPSGANPAQIQYYNGDIPLLQTPLSAPAGTTTFAGLLFPDPVVTRVVVTLGSSEMFDWDGTTVTPGGSGSIAGDDIVLAEPAPARPSVAATAGVPSSPLLDTFTNTESQAAAEIDWGDGTRTDGTIIAVGGGTFNVTGTHAYADSGSYTATVTVRDFAGDEQSSQTVINVASRPTATTVSCNPSPVAVTAATVCTVTVADASPGAPIVPTGTAALSSPTAGAEFDDDGGCVLGPDGVPGVAICQVQFTPSQLPPVQARVDAFYAGDGAHSASAAGTIVRVRPQRCKLKALPARLNRRPTVLGVIVNCNARANVTVAVKAVGARKGSFQAFSLEFGTVRDAVSQGRPTVLVMRPSAKVLKVVRAAVGRHQRVTLKLTLTATSHSARTTTTKRVAAVRLQ